MRKLALLVRMPLMVFGLLILAGDELLRPDAPLTLRCNGHISVSVSMP